MVKQRRVSFVFYDQFLNLFGNTKITIHMCSYKNRSSFFKRSQGYNFFFKYEIWLSMKINTIFVFCFSLLLICYPILKRRDPNVNTWLYSFCIGSTRYPTTGWSEVLRRYTCTMKKYWTTGSSTGLNFENTITIM